MLTDFNKKLEAYLNSDKELQRRLEGFKAFSGTPDGHYHRARQQGISAVARAVKCYPFGGESLLKDCEIVGIKITDANDSTGLIISLKDNKFEVTGGNWEKPHLTLELSMELFKMGLLGRYRWLFLMGMDDVKITFSDNLPHSDWVTILEVLVAMQEVVEFDGELWNRVENY
ncbi:hypothetical protein ACFL20_05180 [Spirochaetota bacterium]